MANPLLLSYSSIELLRACPRKFEIYKILQSAGEKEESIDTLCGTATGLGIQEYFKSKSLDKAIWAAYKAWNRIGLEQETTKKSFWLVVNQLQKLQYTIKERPELNGWELVYFEHPKKGLIPAVELSFKIILNESYVLRGFMDLVLKKDDEYAVLENKTTGWNVIHPAQHQNSNQGSSYAYILDRIVGKKNYHVKYLIEQFPTLKQEIYEFPKGAAARLEWLADLSLECQRIELYKSQQHFPKHGGSCMSFNRPCQFFGICDLNKKALGKVNPDGTYIEPATETFEYDFTFTLDELLEQENLR